MNIETLLESAAEEMLIEFKNVTSQLPHPQKKGEARESSLIAFLRKYLPPQFGVCSGFIIDKEMNLSPQTDVIIYDKHVSPILHIQDQRIFPVECVLAVIEVKSKLDSSELEDSIKKLERIAGMDKTDKGTNHIYVGGGLDGSPMDFNDVRDRIFTAIFSFKSINPETIRLKLIEKQSQIDKRLWVNFICVLDEYYMCYLNANNQITVEQDKASYIHYSDETGHSKILLTFYTVLIDFLNVAHIARTKIQKYCKVGFDSGYTSKI